MTSEPLNVAADEAATNPTAAVRNTIARAEAFCWPMREADRQANAKLLREAARSSGSPELFFALQDAATALLGGRQEQFREALRAAKEALV